MEELSKVTIDPNLLTQEEKKNLYEELWGGGTPDAFSLLANGVREVGTEVETDTGTLRREKTGGYKDIGARNDINGSHGGMVAIRTLKSDYFPEAKVVTNSFNAESERWKEERHAEVAAKELADSGIPEADIIVQTDSVSTVTELLYNIYLAEKYKWNNLVIITNGTQLGRARAMLEKIGSVFDPLKFRERPEVSKALFWFFQRQWRNEVKISIISAEDVLALKSSRHAKLIQAVRESDLYKESKARQDSAAEQIRNGTYGQKPPSVTLLK